jgi:hypothetical protein
LGRVEKDAGINGSAPMFKDRIFWILVLITGVGLLLRMMTVFNLGGFIFDETVSFMIASRPWEEIWGYLRVEVHPIFHSYFLHWWIELFGSTEEITRTSSVFVSLFCFPVLYFLGKEMFGSKKAGLFLSGLFSLSSFLIFYSSLARMYILLFLFTGLSFYFFLKILNSDRFHFSLHSAYVVFTLLAYHTHLTAGVIILIQLSYILLFKLKSFKVFIWDWMVIAVLYLPWFLFFVSHKFSSLTSRAWFFNPPDYGQILFYPFKFIVIDDHGLPLNLLFILIGIMLFALSVNLYHQQRTIEWKKLFLPFLIVIIPSIFLIASNLTVMRYFLIPCLGVLLIVSYFLSRINYRYFSGMVFMVILLGLMFNSALATTRQLTFPWEKEFRFIEKYEAEGDEIILANDVLLFIEDLYYQGGLSAFSFNSNSHSDKLVQVLENCNYATNMSRDKNNLKKIIKDDPRVFLVIHKGIFSAPQLAVKDWFLERGWEVERENKEGRLAIFLLTAPSEDRP